MAHTILQCCGCMCLQSLESHSGLARNKRHALTLVRIAQDFLFALPDPGQNCLRLLVLHKLIMLGRSWKSFVVSGSSSSLAFDTLLEVCVLMAF